MPTPNPPAPPERDRTEGEPTRCSASPSGKHSGEHWCEWCSGQLADIEARGDEDLDRRVLPETAGTEAEAFDVLTETADALEAYYLPGPRSDFGAAMEDLRRDVRAALASRVPPSGGEQQAFASGVDWLREKCGIPLRDCPSLAQVNTEVAARYGPPRAGATGEGVAWEVLNADGTRVSLCGTEDDAEQERREWEMNAASPKPHRVAPLYRAAPPAPAPAVTESMVEAAAAKASRDWDALEESLPERDENHENHIAAAESWLNARLAHHLTATLARAPGGETGGAG